MGALALLQQRRAPYADLLAAVVADTLDRFPPAGDNVGVGVGAGTVAEIGAGAGQLRAWIPAPLRARWSDRLVHTDPVEGALRELRERAPQAKTRVAAAEKLPFSDQECGAVLGLCVFDAIDDEAKVVAEVARVLRPGGRFLHFMDMATLLETPFQKLAASRLVPLPNVFGDPADHEWPLDILLVHRDWMAGLWDIAIRSGHPLATVFARYFRAFLADPFDTAAATGLFQALASDGQRRAELAHMLQSASQAAFQAGYPPIDPLPFHSGRYLESVLQTSFRNSDAFRIEQCEIVTRSARRPAHDAVGVRYRSLCLGHERLSDRLPQRLLTASGRLIAAAPEPASPDLLVEVGMFVFVAQRV